MRLLRALGALVLLPIYGGAAPDSEELIVQDNSLEKAMIAIDAAGRPHVVSDQGLNGRKIFYSYRGPGGWSTSELHPNGRPAGVTAEPRIALGDADTAWVGFHSAFAENRRQAAVSFYRIDHLSGTPVIGPLTQSVHGTRTNLKTDANGNIYVLWRMGTDLFYQVYRPDGKDASPVRRLTNVKITIPDEEMGLCSNSFDFDVGNDGIVHGVCTNILGLVYSSSELEAADRGVLMIARGHEVGCEGPYTVPVLQVDRRDPEVVYVLFAGVENKAYLILKTRAGWRKPVLLAPDGVKQGSRRAPPFLAGAANGGAIAAWMDGRNGRPVIYTRWITADGRFGPETRVAEGRHPRFAIDAQGRLHVVYTRDGALFYRVAGAPPKPHSPAASKTRATSR
jgi:hypothetical protein